MNRGVQMPTTQQMVGQMLFGRRSAKSPRAPTAAGHAETTDLGVPIAFVAIDLLAIDEQALLEIPLLERKRILDTAFDETRLLRRSPYVRPPVDGAHRLASARLPRARLQGGQQPLHARTPERGLVEDHDPPRLTASDARPRRVVG